jgi:enamine deaminase RidA (YjgF/YER057c/UK114 family)
VTGWETSQARARLSQAGIELPEVLLPAARYVPMRRYGRLAFCAGVTSDGIYGTAGVDATAQDGQAAAELAARRALSYVENELGSLDAVADVLRLTGYVACVPGFREVPMVVNAASDVLLTAFGDAGRHARSAIGVVALPVGALVEIELVLTLRDAA